VQGAVESAESRRISPPPVGREPDRVTVLFTDVVGSTELFDRLGDDGAHLLLRRHLALLRGAVRDHGGREVKSLGDGLMVAFTSAQHAVACALTMQRAVVACGDPLELRVGIASGEALREDGDYFGRSVIVARRLCDVGRAGDVLVSAPVGDLTATRDEHQVERQTLTLKGLSQPVAASAMRVRPPLCP
jgi:class 3 adenylate cyclase